MKLAAAQFSAVAAEAVLAKASRAARLDGSNAHLVRLGENARGIGLARWTIAAYDGSWPEANPVALARSARASLSRPRAW
jgi:hypothetical protein